MKTFGLTGGIGWANPLARDLLRQRGFHVIDTDDLARELVQPRQPALAEIAQAFGRFVLDESGQLRRRVLADLVFGCRRAINSNQFSIPESPKRGALNWPIGGDDGVARGIVVIRCF